MKIQCTDHDTGISIADEMNFDGDDITIAEAILMFARPKLEKRDKINVRVRWMDQDIVVQVVRRSEYSISGLRGTFDPTTETIRSE